MEWTILHIVCTIVRERLRRIGKHFHTVGIFAGRHSGEQLETAGKVVDGLKTQPCGDLRKVQPPLADHLFCRAYFHFVEMVDHTAAGLLMEVALQLRAPDQIVPTDLTEGEWLIEPLLQIGDDLAHVLLRMSLRCFFHRQCVAAADQSDQQLLQSGGEELFAAEADIFPAHQCVDRGIVERRGKDTSAFADDARQQDTLLRAGGRDALAEKFHRGAGAAEADDDQVGRDHAVGAERMKLARRVENHLASGQIERFLVATDADRAFIHIQKLPEIVSFAGEGIIAGIFKVVYTEKVSDLQRLFQCAGSKGHSAHPFFALYPIIAQNSAA